MPAFSTQGLGEGQNFYVAQSVSTSTPEYPGPNFTPGIHVSASDGAEWILCQVAAGKTVVANDVVVVTNHATWQIDQLTNTTGRGFLGSRVGVAGASATAAQYVWVQFTGYAPVVNIVTGSTAYTVMHSSATVGRGTTTASGGVSVIVTGLVALATAAANVAACHLNSAVIGAND